MSQNVTSIRPNEEALVALLLMAALVFGGLFVVTKSTAKQYFKSRTKKNMHKTKMCETNEETRDHALGAIRTWEQAALKRIQKQKARKLRRLQSDIRLADEHFRFVPAETHDNFQLQGVDAVLAWEESAMRRHREEKVHRLAWLPQIENNGCAAL